MKQKPLNEQVIVITGASSGIGLVTARMAAKEGAKLVLAARSDDALDELAREINDQGGQAVAVHADVANRDEVRAISERAMDAFGGFDTWVNNAGVSIYGRTEDVPIDDMRHLFETNFWGVVYGSLEAVRHLKTREGGGTLINIGSVLSDRAISLQGIYSASKHAVKGFTDTLRMELEQANTPVHVALVKPSAIDTPYTHHAKNYMETEPKHNPPVYAPELVAQTILHCATHSERELFVGGGGKGMAASGYYTPGLMDKAMEGPMYDGSKSDQAPHAREENALDRPSSQAATGALQERGGYEGHTRETSLYTSAVTHKPLVAAFLAGAGVVALILRARKG